MIEHHGGNRCPDKGHKHYKKYFGLCILATNLHIIGNEFSLGRTVFHWKYVYDNGEIENYSQTLDAKRFQSYQDLIKSLEPNLNSTKWYLIDWQFPFGLEVNDDELIKLPTTSDFIEIGQNKSKMPRQFLDVVERTGKEEKI